MCVKSLTARPVLLDVSLRDGGYLNDWRFSCKAVRLALETAAAADADIIEIGYCDDAPGLPEASACPPEMIDMARGLVGKKLLAGMVRPTVDKPAQVLSKRSGLLDLIRIPVDVRHPEAALRIAAMCRDHGFDLTLNLTSASCFPAEQIADVASRVPDYVTAIYLADSRGALYVDQIDELVAAVRSRWDGAIGYHAHDNLGLAKETTREALQAGCQFIDASIAGVGIGGRNLRLKDALDLAAQSRNDLSPDPGALAVTEEDLGVPAAGSELPLYRIAGQRNIRQEWVEPLILQLGRERAFALVRSLPRRAWFDEEELQPYAERAKLEPGIDHSHAHL